MENYLLYINGEWTGKELDTFDVVNPATAELIASVPNAGAVEAKQATDAAYEAFRTWSALTAYERAEIIWKWHRLIDEHKEELATTMTMEQGKPLKEALGEIS